MRHSRPGQAIATMHVNVWGQVLIVCGALVLSDGRDCDTASEVLGWFPECARAASEGNYKKLRKVGSSFSDGEISRSDIKIAASTYCGLSPQIDKCYMDIFWNCANFNTDILPLLVETDLVCDSSGNSDRQYHDRNSSIQAIILRIRCARQLNAFRQAAALASFRQRCQLYFSVKNVKKDKQVDHILLFSGEDGLKMFKSWSELSNEQRIDPDEIWTRFATQIEPKSNFRVARFYLQKLKQNTAESIDDFLTRCKLQALKCKFRDEQEVQERLIEQLVVGTRHHEIQKDLLGKDINLTLAQATELGRVHEASIQHMHQLSSVQDIQSDIHLITRDDKCRNCGGSHAPRPRRECPAFGSTCNACGKINHWQSVCLSKNRNGQNAPNYDRGRGMHRRYNRRRSQSRYNRERHRSSSASSVHRNRHRATVDAVRHEPQTLRDSDAVTQFSQLTIDDVLVASVDSQNTSNGEALTYIHTLLSAKRTVVNIRVKVDTGAQANILPLRMFRRMFPEELSPEGYPSANGVIRTVHTTITAYNGTKIPQYGTITLPCRYKDNRWIDMIFYVVNTEGPAILGLDSSQELKLVTLQCEINATERIMSVDDLETRYPNQFDRIGNFKGRVPHRVGGQCEACHSCSAKMPHTFA
ncbi:hypothetical protein ScPMuIL_004874 [Solemya velum]